MSARVRFTRDFDYDIPTSPRGRTVAYVKGQEYSVPDAHAEAAEAAGAAERIAERKERAEAAPKVAKP